MAEETVVNTADPTPAEAIEPQATPAVEPTPEPAQEPEEEGRANGRIRELNERLKNTEATLNVAMQTIQNLQRPPAQTPEAESEYLDPAVQKLAQRNKQLETALGGVVGKLDKIEAQSNPEFRDYKKHDAEIERIHNQYLQAGQFVSRSLIYTHLKGQEALRGGGRQPAAPAVTTPETPEAIPQTKAAAKVGNRPKGPETLDEKIAKYKDVVF